jgi:hypothetical protein
MDTQRRQLLAAGLRAELQAVEQDHPRWHAWLSDAGRCWAATTQSWGGGSGFTVDGSTPDQLGHAIAVAEHDWLLTGLVA